MTRRLYWLYLPLLLCSAAVVTWIFPNDLMLLVSGLVGSFVALYSLWGIIGRRGPVRFSHLLCISHLGGYSVGVVNSWLTLPRGDMTLAAAFGRDPEAISTVMAAILFCTAVLYSVGELWEPPVFASDFRLYLDNRAIVFVALGTGLVITGYFTGQLGLNGIAHFGGHISVLGGVLGFIVPPLFAITCFCFTHWRKGFIKWFFSLMLAVQFVMLIPTGRRSMLYCVVLGFIAVRFWEKKRWAFTRRVIYTSIAIAALVTGSTVFYYIRIASWQRHSAISIVDKASAAMALYESGKGGEVNDALRTNLEKRTFVIGYISDLLDASTRMKPALGENAFHSLQLATPSALWENKDQFLYGEEQIADKVFGFNYNDEANSLYSAGLVDFGIWGMITYPILMAALYWLTAYTLRKLCPHDVSTIAILYLIFGALQTEWELSTHFLAIRGALLFAAGLWIIFKVPAFGFAHRRQEIPEYS